MRVKKKTLSNLPLCPGRSHAAETDARPHHEPGKHQTPRPKIQGNTKLQTPTAYRRSRPMSGLQQPGTRRVRGRDALRSLGVWNFSGSWTLVFGSSRGSGSWKGGPVTRLHRKGWTVSRRRPSAGHSLSDFSIVWTNGVTSWFRPFNWRTISPRALSRVRTLEWAYWPRASLR